MRLFEMTVESQIVSLIYFVAHKCAIYCDNNFKKFGMTFTQSVLLFLIDKFGDRDLCQKDIENLLGVKGSSITSLVNNTSKKGLIERIPCATDGRKYYIKLTDKGKNVIKEMRSSFKENKIDLFKELTDEEKQQLIDILLKIT